MPRANLLRQRLLALFLMALFALYSPVVERSASAPGLLGLPALYVYLFGVWAAVIAAAALIVSRGRD